MWNNQRANHQIFTIPIQVPLNHDFPILYPHYHHHFPMVKYHSLSSKPPDAREHVGPFNDTARWTARRRMVGGPKDKLWEQKNSAKVWDCSDFTKQMSGFHHFTEFCSFFAKLVDQVHCWVHIRFVSILGLIAVPLTIALATSKLWNPTWNRSIFPLVHKILDHSIHIPSGSPCIDCIDYFPIGSSIKSDDS